MHRGKKTLSLHLTDLCNNDCVFCVVGIPQRACDLDDDAHERIRDAIRRGAGDRYGAVNIHGGEPTMSPRLLETLELIRECGYPEVHIQTNGRRLCDPTFVRQLRELNVTLFIVSLHGATAGTHDWLTRTPGAYRDAIDGIITAKDAGARLQTNTVIAKQNLAEIPDLVDLLGALEVDSINLSNLHPAETAALNFDLVTPTVSEAHKAVRAAIQRAEHRHIPLSLEGFPYCALPGCDAYHLRRKDATVSVEIRGMWIDDYEAFMDGSQRVKGNECRTCARAGECSGVYDQYVKSRGWGEFHALAAADAVRESRG